MSYRVSILRRAVRSLENLKGAEYERIKAAVAGLAANPRPPGSRKLSGREGWRIRVQNYRVIYEISDAEQTVLVLDIGHRREVYR